LNIVYPKRLKSSAKKPEALRLESSATGLFGVLGKQRRLAI
jgi:hypothetical protein